MRKIYAHIPIYSGKIGCLLSKNLQNVKKIDTSTDYYH